MPFSDAIVPLAAIALGYALACLVARRRRPFRRRIRADGPSRYFAARVIMLVHVALALASFTLVHAGLAAELALVLGVSLASTACIASAFFVYRAIDRRVRRRRRRRRLVAAAAGVPDGEPSRGRRPRRTRRAPFRL